MNLPFTVLALCACTSSTKTKPHEMHHEPSRQTERKHASMYTIYQDNFEVMRVTEQPGTLTSTAPLPPGVAPVQHPFLTMVSYDAGVESQLRDILLSASTAAEFRRGVLAAGFQIRDDE